MKDYLLGFFAIWIGMMCLFLLPSIFYYVIIPYSLQIVLVLIIAGVCFGAGYGIKNYWKAFHKVIIEEYRK